MYINDDLLAFFASMMEPEERMRDFYNSLAAEVDDSGIKESLQGMALAEQSQINLIKRIIDIVNGARFRGDSSTRNVQTPPADRRSATPEKP